MENNNKNLLLFIALTLALIIGWVQLQNWLSSPRPKKPDKAEVAQGEPKPKEMKEKQPKEELPAAQLRQAAQAVGRGVALAARPPSAAQPITLGSDSGNLKAILSPRGAAVLSVTLNKFQQADRMGRPEWLDADKKVPKPLELVTEEMNRDSGSNLLFHFDPNRKGHDPLPTLGEIEWAIAEVKREKEGDGEVVRRVAFATEIDGVRITKTFALDPEDYHIGVEVKLELLPGAEGAKPFRYQFTSAHGLRLEGEWYTNVLRNALIGYHNNSSNYFVRVLDDSRRISHRLGSDPVDVNNGDKLLRYAGVAVQYFASMLVVDDQQENQSFLARARATVEGAAMKGQVKSVEGDKFVLLAADKGEYDFYLDRRAQLLLPPVGTHLAVIYTFDDHNRRVATAFRPEQDTEPLFYNDIVARVTTEEISLKPGVPVVHKYLLYNGPVKVRLLGQLEGDKAVAPQLVQRYEDTLNLNTMTDYHSPGVFGEFADKIYWTQLLIMVTNLMHGVLWALHHYVMPWSWGLCIIMLTVLVRGMMFPVSRKQAQTSIRMQELAPELKKLQEKYKNDRQALGMAQMELYRKHGVNPLGTCWLLFLQMPVFLGLYYALQESIHFRLAPFAWISNLAAPDMLFYWSEQIPWLSRPADYGSFLYLGPYFNLLPVVAVALMILQQHLTAPPAVDEQQAMQMKMMKYMMVIFGLMFYKVAAGLCVYFIASSLWGFAERRLLPKRKPAPGTAPAAGNPPGGLFQKLRERVESLRPAESPAGQPANGPASDAVTSSVSGGAGRKRGKRKRKAGPAPAGGGPARADGSDGGKARSWWTGLRAWWADVLEQARKK
jgi:YidC/Oxa1 family membrane protein insertase